MSGYIYSIVIAAVAMGIVLIISPSNGGLKKHIQLIASVFLICLLIKPTLEFFDAVKELTQNSSSILPSDDGELYDKYESIYENYLDGEYGENIGEAVKDVLYEKFSIKKENCRVLTKFKSGEIAGVRLPETITVILSGSAKLLDPEPVRVFVQELFGCEVKLAVE